MKRTFNVRFIFDTLDRLVSVRSDGLIKIVSNDAESPAHEILDLSKEHSLVIDSAYWLEIETVGGGSGGTMEPCLKCKR